MEAEKNTEWVIKLFSHLASLVINFILDRVVRLNDIIFNLNSKVLSKANLDLGLIDLFFLIDAFRIADCWKDLAHLPPLCHVVHSRLYVGIRWKQ